MWVLSPDLTGQWNVRFWRKADVVDGGFAPEQALAMQKLWLGLPIIIGAASLIPYGVTLASPASLCLPEARVVGKDEKVRRAKEWLRSKAFTSYTGGDCCQVTKGDGSFPALDFGAYVTQGKAHYVFVPKYPFSHEINGKKHEAEWNVVTVDTCGNPLNVGLDL